MTRRILALVIIVIGMPVAAAGAPSAARREAATELLHTINLERAMDSGSTAMADAMIQQNPMLGPYRDVIQKWASTFMTWQNLGPKYVDLYADSFTADELRQMNAFYKTPVGQKALTLMPEMMRRGARFSMDVAQQHLGELQQMIRARAAELTKLSKQSSERTQSKPSKPSTPQ